MNSTTSDRVRRRRRPAPVLLATALVVSGSLLAGGTLVGGAQDPAQTNGNLVVNATWDDSDIDHGLAYARQQRGETMEIQAVLTGLEPNKRYALRFSRGNCRGDSNGLLRKRIPFTSSALGHASIKQANLPKRLFVRTRSFVVVWTDETQLRSCASARTSARG